MNMHIEMETTSSEFGKIRSLQVDLLESDRSSQETDPSGQVPATKPISNVEKVSIVPMKNSMNENNREYNFNDSQHIQQIKKSLSELLGISESIIEVTLHE